MILKSKIAWPRVEMPELIGVFRSEEDYGYVYDVYYTDGLGEESGVRFF